MTKSFICRAAPWCSHSIFGNMIIRLFIKDLKYGPQQEQYSNKLAGAFTSGLVCNSCPSGVHLPPNGTKGGNYKCRYITKRICQNIQNAGSFELIIVLCQSQTELLTRSCFRESCIKSNYPKKIMAETHKFLLAPFHRGGRVLDRKFCLSVCLSVDLSVITFPSSNIQ